jgi:hypothetical protein
MMVPMALGRRLPLSTLALALAVGIAPLLAGCGLLDRGSTLDDAFEYLPAATYSLDFSDRAALAERLGIDDVDPRDISDDDLDDYLQAFQDHPEVVVANTDLGSHLEVMRDAPFNDLDVEWEAHATWGDPDGDSRTALAWKVGDDLDFDDLADDLTDKGYEKSESGGLAVYSVDPSAADATTNTIGGVYPAPLMLNVMLDEDDHVVVSAVDADALDDISKVIGDDADSLADDGGLDDLTGAAEGDPAIAVISTAGPGLCPSLGAPLPEGDRGAYDDLGRPEARALFVSDDEVPKVTLALQYGSDDDAAADLDARRTLVEEGLDQRTRQPFSDLGDFQVEQDGRLLTIDEDYTDGPRVAVQAEYSGGGPGVCATEG